MEANKWVKFEIGSSEFIGRTVIFKDVLYAAFVNDSGETGRIEFKLISNPRLLLFKENPVSKANNRLAEHIKKYVTPWKHKTAYA